MANAVDQAKIAQKKKEMQDDLNRLATERDIAAAQAYRQRLMAARQSADLDAISQLKQAGMTHDEHGREITLWDKLVRDADRAIHSEQNSYNDWRSAMMSLWSLYSTLFDALSNSLAVIASPYTTQAKQLLRDQFLVPFKDKLVDKLLGNPRVDLPALIHDVSLNDQNQLVIGDLERSDKANEGLINRKETVELVEEKTANLNQGFKTLVALWLKEHDYEPGADGTFVKTTGDRGVLTKAAFETLRDDPEDGLGKFLGVETELQYRPRP